MTILGLFLIIILSCSLFDFLYHNLERWKLRALIWMSWYYFSSGLVFLYLIKGVTTFYHDEEGIDGRNITEYSIYSSQNVSLIIWSSILMAAFSAISLFIHIIWKQDILKCLSRIIYKYEIRKEISLRILTKSFTFKLIQVSATYFLKPDA